MTLNFEIEGNQEKNTGNPVPYVRSTQKGFWKANVRRYEAWKRYVVAKYLLNMERHNTAEGLPIRLNWKTSGLQKPIDLDGRKAYMHMLIHWNGEKHGDPDNVWKGIADALFVNDKRVAGSFDYTDSRGGGKVEVQIIIE